MNTLELRHKRQLELMEKFNIKKANEKATKEPKRYNDLVDLVFNILKKQKQGVIKVIEDNKFFTTEIFTEHEKIVVHYNRFGSTFINWNGEKLTKAQAERMLK